MQGKNLPVIPSQVEQGLGSDLLNQIAAKIGFSASAINSQRLGILSDQVDKPTPHGKIEAGGLEQLLKFVQGK